MEIPYIPQGTPITVSINGHWDGMHNGNEPYMSYPGPGDTTKKVYIPHGAYVETKPEQAEKVEFVVDKTPKPPETVAPGTIDELFGDRATISSAELREYLGQPKLSVFRDDYNLTWWEIEPNKFYPADTRVSAEVSAKAWPKDYRDMAYLEEHYTLTDVTDTGEPLDADMQLADDPEYAKFCEEQAKDTPRKPEPGDRVRVIYEATYRVQDWDSHHWLERDGLRTFRVPHDAEITVIEPARPKVPDSPLTDVLEVWYMDDREATETHRYDQSRDLYVSFGGSSTWEHLWTWSQEHGHDLYPLRVERGPVIGG